MFSELRLMLAYVIGGDALQREFDAQDHKIAVLEASNASLTRQLCDARARVRQPYFSALGRGAN